MFEAPNAPLTKVAWIKGNDGWIRTYRVRLSGATHSSPLGFQPTPHSSARSAFATLALAGSMLHPLASALDYVCPDAPFNC